MVENLLRCLPELKDYEEDALLLSTYLVYKLQSTNLPDGFSKTIGYLDVKAISQESSIQEINASKHGITQYRQIVIIKIGNYLRTPKYAMLYLKTQILEDNGVYRKVLIEDAKTGTVLHSEGSLNGKEKMVNSVISLMSDKAEISHIDVKERIGL